MKITFWLAQLLERFSLANTSNRRTRRVRSKMKEETRIVMVEQLEYRVTLSASTVTIDSSSTVSIPVENLKAGQTVKLAVNFTTTDPSDQTEGEPLIIQGSDGFSQAISNFGSQSISIPITQDGERLSAYIEGTDGDESASITSGDRIIQVKMDLAALAAPWLSFEKDLQDSEQAIESILQYSPGFTFYPLKFEEPQLTGEVAGQISEAPDGSIDGGQVSITGGLKLEGTTELYFGLPAKLFGVGASLTLGTGLSVGAMATWDDSGKATYSGQLKDEGSLTLAGNAYATFFKGTVSGKGAIEGAVNIDVDGVGKAEINLTGELAAAVQYKGLSDKDYVTLASVSTPFGPKKIAEKEFKLSDVVDYAIHLAEGSDPLVVTTQPPSNITAGTPFGMVVSAENADGSTNTSFNGNVTIGDNNFYALGGTTTVQAVNGIATFSGLTLKTTTKGDSLYAATNGLPTVSTSSFNVIPAAAAQLTMSSPSNMLANSPFGMTVNVKDQYGNVATTFNGNVTLALSANPSSATLGGTLTVQAVNGVATFTGLTIDKAANGDTLTATSTGLTSVTTYAFNVTDQLMITTQPPGSITAGMAFGLVIKAEDYLGNVDTSFNGSVTVSDYYGYSLYGTRTVQAVNGVATFAGLTEDIVRSYSDYIYAYANGLPSAMSSSFVVKSATETQLTMSSPGDLLANSPFDMTVNVEDQFGNVATTFNGNVTLALSANPGSATLGGTLTVQAVNGVATFNGLTISKAAIGYTLMATSAGLTSVTTYTFNVTDQLVITTQPPNSVTAGTAFGLVVMAEDYLGNVDTSFTGSVTVADYYGYSLSGTRTVQAVNGVATFSGLTEVTARGYSDYIYVTSNGLPSVNSSSFTVAAAAATQLVMLSAGDVANVPFGMTVDAKDQYGNIATTFNGNVTLALSANPGNATLGGKLTVQAVNGVATFNGLTINKLGNGYTLTATSSGLPSVTTATFNVYDRSVITTQPPSSVTAGTAFGFVVKAEDGQGNVDTSYTGAITVALSFYTGGSTSSLTGTTTVAAVNGVATFSGLMLTQAQAGTYGLVISGSYLLGSSVLFNLKALPASQLAVTTQTTAATTGAPFTIGIAAEDSYGNVDPTFNGKVTLSIANNPGSATLGGTLTVTAVNGVATFSGLTLSKPSVGYTLKASSNLLTPVTTSQITVTAPGVANRLAVTTQPPSAIRAGSSFGLIIKAEDGLGTVDTTFNGSVTLSLVNSPGALGGTTTVTAVNGVATFSGLKLTQATATASLLVSSTGLISATTNVFRVAPAAATTLAVILPYGSILTNVPFSVSVEGEDAYGNVDTNYSGNVTLKLASNPGNAALGGTLTGTAYGGVITFNNLTINNAGSSFTLQATCTGLTTGNSSLFEVTNDQLKVTTQPPVAVDDSSSFGLVVAAVNSAGAVDVSFNGTLTLSIVNFGSNTPSLGGTISVTAVNGVAAFSGLTLNQPGVYALSVTGNGIAGTTTQLLKVTSLATQLRITTQPPVTATAGNAFSLDVAAEDSYGNVDTTFNGTVTLALAANPGSATLSGTLTVKAVNGVAILSGLTISKPGNGYTLNATSTGLTAATTGAINVTAAGIATHLVVTTQPPATIAAGSGFGLVVKAEDGFGTLATTFNGSVTLALASSPHNGTVGGLVTVKAVNGVATFAGLTMNSTGVYTLSATSNGFNSTTNSITVTPAAATQLSFIETFGSALSGGAFGVTVNALDSFGNLATTFNGNVTLALSTNPAGGSLGGTLTVQAVNGVATFTGVTISKPGDGEVLQATCSGLATAISFPFRVANDQLVVTVQPPSNVSAGVGFGFTVSAQNSTGNVDTAFNGTVIVSFNPVFGGLGSLGNTVSVTAVNGVATFSGLKLNAAGQYSMSAASNGVHGTTTGFFNVNAAAATQLVATKEPHSAITVGAGFEADFAAEDPYGNVDMTSNGNVMVALGNQPPGAVLGGTLTATVVNGVAVFNGLTINKTGSGATLQTTANGLTNATTNTFNVTAKGVATKLVVTTQPPSKVNAGSGFGLVVQAEDDFGTVDTAFNGTVTVNNPVGGAPLSQKAAVNGVVSFAGVTLNMAGDAAVLSVTSNSFAVITNPISVNALAATHLEIAGPYSNVLPGSLFDLDVYAKDQYGNIDPSNNSTVTLIFANNPSGAALGGTVTVTLVNGSGSFTGLSISKAGSAYTLQATATGLTAGTSLPFNVTKDQLAVTTQPPSFGTGSGFGFVVAAENASGNVDTSFNGSVTLSLLDYGGTGANLGGTLTATAVNGVVTFTNLNLAKQGTYGIMGSGTGIGLTVTDPFSISGVTTNPATQLAFQSVPVTTTAGVPLTALKVAVKDASGNVVTTDTSTVTLSVISGPGNFAPNSVLTATAIAGVATFNNLILDTSGTYTFGVTDGTLTSAVSGNVTVNAAAANKLVLQQVPTSGVAGVALNPAIKVAIEDTFGNVVIGNTSNVTVALNSGPTGALFATGSTLTVAAVAGVATFSNLVLKTAGVYTLKVTDGSLTSATTNNITIGAAAAAKTVVLASPTSATAGVAFTAVKVGVEDQFGNLVQTAQTVKLTLASGLFSTGLSTATATTTGGVATFTGLIINTAGTYTINVSDGTLTGSSFSVIVNTAAASKLVLQQVPTTGVAGVALNTAFKVAIEDTFGNVVIGNTSNVTVALNSGPTGAQFATGSTLTVAAVAGVATFSNLVLKTAGVYTMKVTDGTLTSATSGNITIGAAAAAKTVVLASPTSATAGVAFTAVNIGVEDQYGNLVQSAQTVKLTLASGLFSTGLSSVTAATTAGVATFSSLIINTSGTYTINVSDGTLTGSSFSVTVNAAAANKLVLQQVPTSGVAGVALNPAIKVAIEDTFGNIVIGNTSNVTVALNSGPTGALFATGSTLTVAAVAGVATFSNLVLKTAGVYTLKVTDGTLTSATSGNITVGAAAAAKTVVLASPTSATAGVAFTAVTVGVEDQYGNLVQTAQTVKLTLASGLFSTGLSTVTATTTAGVATFSSLIINTSGTYTINVSDGTLTGSSFSFKVNAAAPNKLFFTAVPSSGSLTNGLANPVTVSVEDQFGNVVIGNTSTVTLTISSGPSGGAFSSGTSISLIAVSGLATFNNVKFTKAGTYQLKATSGTLTVAVSGNIVIS